MNILILGSGGREHALAWKIAQSPLVDQVMCAPGNPGMDEIGPCFDVNPTDIGEVVKLVLQIEPDLIVIGPEAPLAAGVSDVLRARGFDVFGPSQAAAQLESSKAFSKERMVKYGVPTAAYRNFGEGEEAAAEAFLETLTAPYVLKADGLASGKGVSILDTLEEAKAEARNMLGGKFGDASANLVIEEFMAGEEASIFVITDGEGAIYLPAAQDHKRVGDGDTGPNTGGMGAYSPAPVVTAEIHDRIMKEVIYPTVEGMAAEGNDYTGFLYAGLMIDADGTPKVIEYNCRFGDPETQPIMMRLQSDLAALCLAALDGKLDQTDIQWDPRPTLGVVMAAGGYPDSYDKGDAIEGLDLADSDTVKVFHAGTAEKDGQVVTSGGRVLCVTGVGDTVSDAQANAYAGVKQITWRNAQYRTDIGYRAVAREKA